MPYRYLPSKDAYASVLEDVERERVERLQRVEEAQLEAEAEAGTAEEAEARAEYCQRAAKMSADRRAADERLAVERGHAGRALPASRVR